MLFNRVTAMAICLVISSVALCQIKEPKIKFGDIHVEDFEPVYYSIDSSASAIGLYESGSVHFEESASDGYSVILKVFKRIRFLRKRSFNDAVINLSLLNEGSIKYTLDSLEAVTYNIENDEVVSSAVDESNVFVQKEQNSNNIKVAFQNLQEGSIVEYRYIIKFSSYFLIPSWSFQDKYPKLWSEYSIEVPDNFDFAILTQGFLKPVIDTTQIIKIKNSIHSFGSGLALSINSEARFNAHKWAFKNLPAIHDEENYIASILNYKETLEFQLASANFPDGYVQHFSRSWPEITKELLKSENFGSDLSKPNNWMDDKLSSYISKTDSLETAKNIYNFIRNKYYCTDYSNLLLSKTIKQTWGAEEGNVADINLLLTALLKHAGFIADPTILSTRQHGKAYDKYPMLDNYDYAIVRLKLEGRQYLLDASDKNIGFGYLPVKCYNGLARIINSPSEIIDLSADSLDEVKVTTAFLSCDSDKSIKGVFKITLGKSSSYNLRKKVSETSLPDISESFQKNMQSDVALTNLYFDSLHIKEAPVTVHFDLAYEPVEDVLYFNPMLSEAEKENPFVYSERNYPIEMSYCFNSTYILNMDIPVGYKVDELPKSSIISLNGNEGKFEYMISNNSNKIQLLCTLKLNRANFEPQDYQTLRNFFELVIKKEDEQIVFKKI